MRAGLFFGSFRLSCKDRIRKRLVFAMNEIEIFDLPSEPRESAHERIQGLREQIVTGELDNLIVEPGVRGMRGLFVATLNRIIHLRHGDVQ